MALSIELIKARPQWMVPYELDRLYRFTKDFNQPTGHTHFPPPKKKKYGAEHDFKVSNAELQLTAAV